MRGPAAAGRYGTPAHGLSAAQVRDSSRYRLIHDGDEAGAAVTPAEIGSTNKGVPELPEKLPGCWFRGQVAEDQQCWIDQVQLQYSYSPTKPD